MNWISSSLQYNSQSSNRMQCAGMLFVCKQRTQWRCVKCPMAAHDKHAPWPQEILHMKTNQCRSWAKPNETLALGLQKFLKKLHRKKPPKFFFKPPNLPKKNFSRNFLETAYSPLNLGAGPETNQEEQSAV